MSARDETCFWHPFANMAEVKTDEIVFVRGEGTTLIDRHGKRYFDASAGLWYCAVGYGREEIADAIAEQARRLHACSCFAAYVSDVTLELADLLASRVPVDGGRVFFTSGGSDGIETAAKIVRRHFALTGRPEKTIMAARDGAYHGSHACATSLTGISANHDGFGSLFADVLHVPPFDAEALERAIESAGPETVAAFFVEPVIGSGGVLRPPENYLRAVANICRRHEVMLVCDEVVTAFGRLGNWFASDRYGVRPDVVVLAKGLTSGYQPLGAVVFSDHVAEPFFGAGGDMLRHGYTYSGHATGCAAALANIDIIEREHLVERVAELEPRLPGLLTRLQEVDGVTEVRTIGLAAGVQLDVAVLARWGVSALDVIVECRRRGVATRTLGPSAIQFSPALICEEAEIVRFADVVAESMGALLARGTNSLAL